MTLVDDPQRRRALTSLNENLFVEAAAGTGKTALMTGRIAMLLAEGRPPGDIAAITFTELAASELTVRVARMVEALLAGEVPRELQLALPNGLDAGQRQHLATASGRLDELTTSTIMGSARRLSAAMLSRPDSIRDRVSLTHRAPMRCSKEFCRTG